MPNSLPTFRLDGRAALVTSASSGLGVRFARVLAEAGARVVLAARRLERLETLRDELLGAGHQGLRCGHGCLGRGLGDCSLRRGDRQVR